MHNSPEKQKGLWQLLGWILFVICALLFLASSIRNRDTLAFFGSLFFLVACLVFMVPLCKSLYGKKKR